MTNEVQDFLSSWNRFSYYDKNHLLSALKQNDLSEAVELKPAIYSNSSSKVTGLTSNNVEDQVYGGVELHSHHCYFYYYPTMHWQLDQPPDTDYYWIGMFRKDASDSDYLRHKWQWLRNAAQGSYYAGRIKHLYYRTLLMGQYSDEYELRIFNGDNRLTAKTNNVIGSVAINPTNPLPLSTALEFKQLEADVMKDNFMEAIESVNEDEVIGSQISKEDFHKKWNSFTPMQKQLLYPVLKHSSFPDEIKNPAPKLFTDRPEPKVLFPNLGKVPQLNYLEADSNNASSKIVLNITLGHSYTYVYPEVEVCRSGTVGTKNAYMGVFYTQR